MRHGRGKTILAAWLLLGVAGGGGFLTASALAQDKPRPGDPEGELPAGAIARLGTTRFRHADPVTAIAFAADGQTIVTAAFSRPSGVRFWNPTDGKERPRLKERWQ